jgi:PTS system nitrogen regulatory IIA component
MIMTLKDVADLFNVGENKIHRWIQEDNLPAEVVNSRYRFNRGDLLEWATLRKIHISPAIFQHANGDALQETGLADALELGGVTHLASGWPGADLRSVLQLALDKMPLPENFDRLELVELLLARESVGSTALGDGIAIPHPRYPVVLDLPRPAVRLCFLAEPIDFRAPDGKPVDTLFVIVCPTVHDHLQLLARLASVLSDENFRRLLRARAPEAEVIREARRVEEGFERN